MARSMRAVRYTLGRSLAGTKPASSALSRPAACRNISPNASGTSTSPTTLTSSRASRAGRMTAISGSRPTIRVSVWCRVWLQRQVVGSRMIMNEASWYRPWSSQRVLNAVPCPASCQRESDVDPYSSP